MGTRCPLVRPGKTYFVASSPAAERALKKKLGAGDPPIQTVAKDLGMELTGGRRRCTRLSSARRRKATARLGKLKGLRIKSPRTTSRIFSMSVLASGQWGHQAQGVSPKVMRSVRLQAASIAGRVNTGSIEVALEMGGPLVQDPLGPIVTSTSRPSPVSWPASGIRSSSAAAALPHLGPAHRAAAETRQVEGCLWAPWGHGGLPV